MPLFNHLPPDPQTLILAAETNSHQKVKTPIFHSLCHFSSQLSYSPIPSNFFFRTTETFRSSLHIASTHGKGCQSPCCTASLGPPSRRRPRNYSTCTLIFWRTQVNKTLFTQKSVKICSHLHWENIQGLFLSLHIHIRRESASAQFFLQNICFSLCFFSFNQMYSVQGNNIMKPTQPFLIQLKIIKRNISHLKCIKQVVIGHTIIPATWEA